MTNTIVPTVRYVHPLSLQGAVRPPQAINIRDILIVHLHCLSQELQPPPHQPLALLLQLQLAPLHLLQHQQPLHLAHLSHLLLWQQFLLLQSLLLLSHPPVSREGVELSEASRILREGEPVGEAGGVERRAGVRVDEGRVGGEGDGDQVGLPHVAVSVRLLLMLLRPAVAAPELKLRKGIL